MLTAYEARFVLCPSPRLTFSNLTTQLHLIDGETGPESLAHQLEVMELDSYHCTMPWVLSLNIQTTFPNHMDQFSP